MDHQVDVHIPKEIALDVINDIMADQDILLRRDLAVYRSKAAARPIVVYIQVVQAQNTVVAQDLLVNTLHQFFGRRDPQQRIAGFHNQLHAADHNQKRHNQAHPAIQIIAGQPGDPHANQNGNRAEYVVAAVRRRRLQCG